MSDQKNWDTALIKTWRQAGNVGDVYVMFKALAGKRTDECDPPLKRMPAPNYPWKIGVRVFVANHLSKISKRLWEQSPEKDILLIRKLETSAYDTEGEKMHVDKELARERVMLKQTRERRTLTTSRISDRNKSTDWNVTK
jgi:hypothetical protein